jgi:hypothetical protein
MALLLKTSKSSITLPSAAELDFLVTSIRQDDPEETRLRLMRIVLEAVVNPIRQQYEKEASLNYQYIENDFYTADELAEFADRGQPPTKRNEIAPIMERLAGQFIQTRQTATFLGRNTPADDQTGAVMADTLRWNDQQNLYEFEEQDMSWDGLVGGVGWVEHYIKKNEMGQDYECKRARNPFHIFKDPYSTRYDPNEDAKYIVDGAWMDMEDVIALLPDNEKELEELQAGAAAYSYFDIGQISPSLLNESQVTPAIYSLSVMNVSRGRRRVRPFKIWYKRKVRLYWLMKPDGIVALPVPLDSKTAQAVVKELGRAVVPRKTFQDRMYCGFMLADALIHHDVSPHWHNFFPYVPFYSGIRKNGAPLPLTSRLVPINEAINKRESKALSLLTNNKIIAEKNAVDDPDETAAENARPDGYVEVREGTLSNASGPKILFEKNLEMGQAQMGLLQEDKDAMRRVSGQGNESMGMPSEVRSGTGIARKQMMSNLIVTPVQNNLRRTRMLGARLSFAHLKQYVTEEMTFQITDDPNAAKTVSLTRSHLQAIKERIYDIVIVETKDYATLREQQAEMLLTVLPQLAQLGPGMVKLGIQLTDFRDKDGLMRMIDQQAQPHPVQPKISLAMTWADLQPEEKAFLAMQAFQSPELAQAIMKAGDDPAFLEKLKAQIITTQIKEGTRATIERGKLDLSAYATAIDGRMRAQEILDKRAGQASPDAGADQSSSDMEAQS